MNFPRYIQREARDVFYLTEKRLLPGTPLTRTEQGAWTRAGLTEERYPFAVMRSTFRLDPELRPNTKAHALELDPTLLEPVPAGAAALLGVVPTGEGQLHLIWTATGQFELVTGSPGHGAIRLASGQSTAMPGAVAAVGLRDRFLVYVEVSTGKQPDADGQALVRTLNEAGCSEVLVLTEPLVWLLAQGRDLSGHPSESGGGPVFFGKALTSRARRIFTETPVVERSVWRPLQRRRTP
jgi:hypothetical protein